MLSCLEYALCNSLMAELIRQSTDIASSAFRMRCYNKWVKNKLLIQKLFVRQKWQADSLMGSSLNYKSVSTLTFSALFDNESIVDTCISCELVPL